MPYGGMKSTDLARTKYIPSLATTRYTFEATTEEGQAILEKVWNVELSGHPARRMPIPADSQMDLQTFFFGPMSHSLTLRPRRPVRGCCSNTFAFDIATDAFSPSVGTGNITHSCCALENEVKVMLPTGPLQGAISRACCTCQPRTELKWSSGEVMGYRYPPSVTCCGPWRTGFVGTAPGEEENFHIRYWDVDGLFVDCNMDSMCLACCAPCKLFCLECRHCCRCIERQHFTSWYLWSLTEIRDLLLDKYTFKLRSAFGEPTYQWLGDDLFVHFRNPSHPSDVNALGNWRANSHKVGCCCKFIMTDSGDVPTDLALATGFDLSFRGTFDQNNLDSKDFNLALGYLVLRSFFYQSLHSRQEGLRVHEGLGLRRYRALLRPRMDMQYMAPPGIMMAAAPPPVQM